MDRRNPKLIRTELPGIGYRVDAAFEYRGRSFFKDSSFCNMTLSKWDASFCRIPVLLVWIQADTIQLFEKKSGSHADEQWLDGLWLNSHPSLPFMSIELQYFSMVHATSSIAYRGFSFLEKYNLMSWLVISVGKNNAM